MLAYAVALLNVFDAQGHRSPPSGLVPARLVACRHPSGSVPFFFDETSQALQKRARKNRSVFRSETKRRNGESAETKSLSLATRLSDQAVNVDLVEVCKLIAPLRNVECDLISIADGDVFIVPV